MLNVDLTAAGGARLVSEAALTPDNFHEIARDYALPVLAARKAALISSRMCVTPERVETRWNGRETSNMANPFDQIVTNLDKTGRPLVDQEGHHNIYVIAANRFATLYQPATVEGVEGRFYRARASVEAIFLPGGFEIVAPWGETQSADRGYLICNGPDVYGNNAETFAAGYDLVASK